VAIKERALGPEHPDLARSLNGLGWVLMLGGNNAGAEPVLRRALAIQERATGPDHLEVAEILNSLGLVLTEIGDYAGARPALERALQIRERGLGPDHRLVGVSLNNLALLLAEVGDNAAARAAWERVAAIMEQALRPDHPLVATALNNLGAIAYWMGDLREARAYLQRAFDITLRGLGADHPEIAMQLHNLANVDVELGDYTQARGEYERARELREREAQPEPERLAMTLTGLASLLTVMGEVAEARPMFERALALRERVAGPDHPNTAATLSAFAGQRRAAGEPAEAMRLLERALTIWDRAYGRDDIRTAGARINKAELLALTGDVDGAVRMALESETSRRNHLRLTLRTLPERQALTYQAAWRGSLDMMVFVLAQHAGTAAGHRADVLDAAIRSRALVLDEMASRHQATAAGEDEETARLARGYREVRERLAKLLVRSASSPSPILNGHIERARIEGERVERALAERSLVFRRERARRLAGLREVAAALAPASALIAFVNYHAGLGTGSDANLRTSPRPRNAYAAFVLRAGGDDPAFVPLGRGADIEAAIAAWRRQILQESVAQSGASRRAEVVYARAAASLRRRIWDPVAVHLGEVRRLYIVPDGEIHLVDFATLPAIDGPYLAESGPEIHYLAAERDLLVDPLEGTGKGLLVVGAPAFDATRDALASATRASAPAKHGVRAAPVFRGAAPGCRGPWSARFDPLPASAEEAAQVMSVWTRGAAGASVSSRGEAERDVMRLDGASAGETAFKRAAPGRRILHLATHGFFLDDRCGAAADPSAGRSTSGRARPAWTGDGDNPLRLAGLAFAGANHRTAASPDEDDGILTAEEVGALDLSGVEWAVLSACDTGLGERRIGEGVLGLRRAFQVAGVRTVIMSLWPVDDRVARAWMSSLYHHRFVRGLGTVEAVRAAALEQLRRRRRSGLNTHPFYWGGFAAVGDPR
jgi:CHAT domain-containing protein/tetratricopeptide (TPR) repeat protein